MIKPVAYFILITINLTAIAQVEHKYVRRGNKDYANNHYQEAEINFRRALEKNPESIKASFNLGNAMYKQDQYEAAAARYNSLLNQTNDKMELSRYYYNLGNTLFRTQKLEESISAYKNALLNNPDDMDAKHNLQMALRMLEEKKQSEGKDQQNGQDQNKQAGQEQQQSDNQVSRDQTQDQQTEGETQNTDSQPYSRGQISPEDAERILQALENEEKNVLKRVQELQNQIKKVPVEKNW